MIIKSRLSLSRIYFYTKTKTSHKNSRAEGDEKMFWRGTLWKTLKNISQLMAIILYSLLNLTSEEIRLISQNLSALTINLKRIFFGININLFLSEFSGLIFNL